MAHKVFGEGDMKISNRDGTYSRVHAWYTPTMPTTALSPGEVIQRHQKLYKANTIYYDEEDQLGYVKYHGRVSSCDVIINTNYHNKKAFTLTLVPIKTNNGIEQNDDEVNYMTEDDGILKIKNLTDIDK
eukprot:9607254-Ditylum_brightwellii.AAC.1